MLSLLWENVVKKNVQFLSLGPREVPRTPGCLLSKREQSSSVVSSIAHEMGWRGKRVMLPSGLLQRGGAG
jgi:hypothetical protein